MIAAAQHILEYLQPDSMVQVVDMDGNDAFLAGFERIKQLADNRRICGKVTKGRLRYVELLVPLSELESAEAKETPSSINARTNIGAYRQHLQEKTCWALCMSSV